MHNRWLLLVLALALVAARAVSQEIVIEPTNGHAQAAKNGTRPAAIASVPAAVKKPVPKSSTPPAAKRVSHGRSTKQPGAKGISPKQTATTPATSESQATAAIIPAPKKAPVRPEWAISDTRDARSLQVEITTALARDPELANSSIQVKVDDAAVTLEGHASGNEERLQAQRLAQSYAWNRKLVDHLELVPKVSAQK